MNPPEMLQDEQEFAAFLDIVKDLGATSYLEVGAKFGGTFYRVSKSLPVGSRVVAVHMPGGTKAWSQSEKSLCAVRDSLIEDGYECHLIWGDSTNAAVVDQVKAFGHFDCILIDANHTLPYVRRDWASYKPLARKAVAFHDISWNRAPTWVGTRIDVPQFWNEVKGGYHHTELRHDTSRKNNGIGVVYV